MADERDLDEFFKQFGQEIKRPTMGLKRSQFIADSSDSAEKELLKSLVEDLDENLNDLDMPTELRDVEKVLLDSLVEDLENDGNDEENLEESSNELEVVDLDDLDELKKFEENLVANNIPFEIVVGEPAGDLDENDLAEIFEEALEETLSELKGNKF